MPIKPLFRDFFRFLDPFPAGDPWVSYRRIYLDPHAPFFRAYWKTFNHFDRRQIAARVRQIKEGDYTILRSLMQGKDPVHLSEGALQRCQAVLPLDPEPGVFLFVGFFSADGVTLEVGGKPVIAVGLERFKDFRDLPLIIAHEYGHCAQHALLKKPFSPGEKTLFDKMVAEGLAVLFTEVVYPKVPLHRHLFLTPERLQWGWENQEALLELVTGDLSSPKLVPVLFGAGDPRAGLPPRLGYFIARQMLGHCLTHHGPEDFGKNFSSFAGLFQKTIARETQSPGPTPKGA